MKLISLDCVQTLFNKVTCTVITEGEGTFTIVAYNNADVYSTAVSVYLPVISPTPEEPVPVPTPTPIPTNPFIQTPLDISPFPYEPTVSQSELDSGEVIDNEKDFDELPDDISVSNEDTEEEEEGENESRNGQTIVLIVISVIVLGMIFWFIYRKER